MTCLVTCLHDCCQGPECVCVCLCVSEGGKGLRVSSELAVFLERYQRYLLPEFRAALVAAKVYLLSP